MKRARNFFTFLALVLMLSVTHIPAYAISDSGACGKNASWSFDSQSGILLISGSGEIDGYEKLAEINGKLGSTASAPWKQYSDDIRSISIEEGITSIGESAFKKLNNLTEVKLPSTLQQIEKYAFTRCGSLERVIIPENVRYIGCNVFLGAAGETKPDIYFLGSAPSAKTAGTMGRSFSNNATIYYISGTSGWSVSTWNGYKTQTWDGMNFPTAPSPETENGGPGQNTGGNLQSVVQNPSCCPDTEAPKDEKVKVWGRKCYSFAYEVVDSINTLRWQKGLPALEIDDTLMNVAMQRAADCSVYYSHTRPNETSCLDIFPAAEARGENIAAGQTSPASVMEDWTNSPGHYSNMVSTGYTRVGVGCFYIDGRYFWAQSFSSGQASTHPRSGDTKAFVSVPVSPAHFNLQTSSKTISVGINETTELPVKIINSGFHNYATTIQVDASNCSYSSIVSLSGQPLSITGHQAGTGTITVKFENGKRIQFRIIVPAPQKNVVPVEQTPHVTPDSPVNRGGVEASQSESTWATNKGLFDGTYPESSAPMSRGMTAKFLHKLEGSPTAAQDFSFVDVNGNCKESVNWVVSCGLMSGYSISKFCPDNTLTREQMAAILYRFARYKGLDTSGRADISGFSDAQSVSSYVLDAVRWATYEGLMTGTKNGTLSPSKVVTTTETSAFFMRLYDRFDLNQRV